MSTTGTLFELIQRLDEFRDAGGHRPLAIYAEGGSGAGRRSRALICPRGEGDDASLAEVLSVEQARDAIAVWSAWRHGLTPTPEERFRTVMFFSQSGAYLPLETDREGM